MRQSDSVSEELDTENVQCALDFENTMNGAGDTVILSPSAAEGSCSAGHGSGL